MTYLKLLQNDEYDDTAEYLYSHGFEYIVLNSSLSQEGQNSIIDSIQKYTGWDHKWFILIHGSLPNTFNKTEKLKGILTIAAELAYRDEAVIILDWTDYATYSHIFEHNYPCSAENVKDVAKHVSQLGSVFAWFGYYYKYPEVHIIGEFMGAHIATNGYKGWSGHTRRVKSMTLIDPAGYLFTRPYSHFSFGIRHQDLFHNITEFPLPSAVIHCDTAGFGSAEMQGGANYWVNRGHGQQPGCTDSHHKGRGCSHYACRYYMELSFAKINFGNNCTVEYDSALQRYYCHADKQGVTVEQMAFPAPGKGGKHYLVAYGNQPVYDYNIKEIERIISIEKPKK